MAEGEAPIDAVESAQAGEGKVRQRSTIGFPYTDYDGAALVAAAIHGNVGHGACATDQLAPWMKQSPKSSSFRTQLAAARLFGLIESENSESYRLTDLGARVMDPAQARAAKAEAFLKVPLFAALFDKYKGGVVPPSAAVEREIVALGVSVKQKARARQVFESSATQTGFREQGLDRLVMPAAFVPPPGVPVDSDKGRGSGSGGGSGGSGGGVELNLDPLLIALLQKIPSNGQQWPIDRRLRWFKTFAMNVSQVYDTDDDAVELDIRAGGQGS